MRSEIWIPFLMSNDIGSLISPYSSSFSPSFLKFLSSLGLPFKYGNFKYGYPKTPNLI